MKPAVVGGVSPRARALLGRSSLQQRDPVRGTTPSLPPEFSEFLLLPHFHELLFFHEFELF